MSGGAPTVGSGGGGATPAVVAGTGAAGAPPAGPTTAVPAAGMPGARLEIVLGGAATPGALPPNWGKIGLVGPVGEAPDPASPLIPNPTLPGSVMPVELPPAPASELKP